MKSPSPAPPSRYRVPPTLILLGILLVLAGIASLIVPAGEFEREQRTIARPEIVTVELIVEPGETALHEVVARAGYKTAEHAHAIDLATGAPAAEPLAEGTTLQLDVHTVSTRSVVVPGSYQRLERPESASLVASAGSFLGALLMAPIRGFVQRVDIIAFILIVGASFALILGTGAVDAGLKSAVHGLSRTGHSWIAIPVLMTFFSLCGAIFGMSEEIIPFVMITIPLAIRLGYDSLTGLCISFVAAGLGFAGAFLNPFTLGIAQGIAELPIFSGRGFRMAVWAAVTLLGIAWTMRWAARVKANPALSPVHEHDKHLMRKFAALRTDAPERVGVREAIVLLIVLATIVLCGWGVTKHDWYIHELSAVFLGAGVLSAFIGRLSMGDAANAFARGASDLAGAALVVAIAAGIVGVLADAKVLDTILQGIAGTLEGTPAIVSAWLMFLFQSLFNIVVPSGSGQAAMTMPLMAPMADLSGISRQVAVLAYQFGDGFSNMIIPTSAVTMSVLGIAEIPWEKWAKWLLPLELLLFAFGLIVLAIAVVVGFR